MRIVIQRVRKAKVTVENKKENEIKNGLLLFVGIEASDLEIDLDKIARKVVNMRIFSDDDGLMNLNIKQIGGEILAISQFTLLASTKKGNRPSFMKAAKPDIAEPLFDTFCEILSKHLEKPIKTGFFGEDMDVSLLNDGPVTITIDTKEWG